jgi:hypothetical protein
MKRAELKEQLLSYLKGVMDKGKGWGDLKINGAWYGGVVTTV